ncbi:cytochrome-c peroxidase [Chitinophaga flava]|uniref:Cytochrome-c peroxidase n=1 Tax=Chitinophaga flava TaxID=2259036 RepID=A0A365XX72_9BACT|nr:cytochrome c peroxidase [Chitinophaga flava]RBL90956.1 cytochrome-c peroxidase [Chitinophaga flava]
MMKIIVVGMMTALLAAGVSVVRKPVPAALSWPAYFGNRVFVPADNPTTEEGVQLGRMLFYEKALSVNDKMSCATCHQQAKAFTDGKTFSAGADGTLQPRNTMALVNLLWVRLLFWDGRAAGLEEQAITPLTAPHEMGQSLENAAAKLRQRKHYPALFLRVFGNDSITGDRIVKALAQFERTLISANSRYDQYLQGKYQPTVSESKGISLFYTNPDPSRNIRGASCGHCHGGPKTYSDLFHNNGLDAVPADKGRQNITGQAYDNGRFRVATLRNIALTAPYMHDGRFKTLEEVIDHYSEHIAQSETLSPFLQRSSNIPEGTSLQLFPQEKKDLLAFLHMLTDSSFITDPRFSNPFPVN